MVDGKFSVKSTYISLTEGFSVQDNGGWNVIWKAIVPPRIKHFFWLVKHKKILTNMERVGGI